ncbi:MAG TPA: SgcJ/EcaC family oxidoreductase [Phycisphaerae bacterium]|nr:SgcJ/EcaC family oxidoreductase [Phycisphaerae bacterium]
MIPIPQMLFTTTFVLLLAAPAQSANPEDEKAIRESAAKYAEAYSRGDVDTLVAQFTKDATFDEGEGPVIAGSDEIRKVLAAGFAEDPGTKMSIDIKSIRFTKGRAIEIGTATLTAKTGEPSIVAYRAIHAKQPDGKWLMTSVGPDVTAEGSTSAGPLDELAWLLGDWKDSEADVDLSCICKWDPNRRFLIRSFVMTEEGRSALEVTEVIGWDAADRIVRSWVFDSDGGVGQNTWSKRGDEWIISAKGTLADGGRASAVNILHPIDDHSYTWSSTNRDVDGEMLPDIDDIKMVRATDAQAATGGTK